MNEFKSTDEQWLQKRLESNQRESLEIMAELKRRKKPLTPAEKMKEERRAQLNKEANALRKETAHVKFSVDAVIEFDFYYDGDIAFDYQTPFECDNENDGLDNFSVKTIIPGKRKNLLKDAVKWNIPFDLVAKLAPKEALAKVRDIDKRAKKINNELDKLR